MSIKNHTVLSSKVTMLLCEPVRGFDSEQHVPSSRSPCSLLAEVLDFGFPVRSGGRGLEYHLKFPRNQCQKCLVRLDAHGGTMSLFNTNSTCDFQ